MSIRESSLWRWLRDNAPAGCEMARIENAVAFDTPDVFGVWRGVSFAIELKIAKVTVSGIADICHWTSGQRDLMRRWNAKGGNIWALIQVGEGRLARRYLIMNPDLPDKLPEGKLDIVNDGHETAEELLEMIIGKGECT